MPTRIFRSETRCQGPLGRSAVFTPDSPRIFSLGASAARSRLAPAASAKDVTLAPRRNARREGDDEFIAGSSGSSRQFVGSVRPGCSFQPEQDRIGRVRAGQFRDRLLAEPEPLLFLVCD